MRCREISWNVRTVEEEGVRQQSIAHPFPARAGKVLKPDHEHQVIHIRAGVAGFKQVAEGCEK